MTKAAGGVKLCKAVLQESFVSCSVPAATTNRDAVKEIAAKSSSPIPIEYLSEELNLPRFLKGQVFFGDPGTCFDGIVSEYKNLQWWISSVGLNIGPVPNQSSGLSDFDNLAGNLMREARPLRGTNGRLPAAEVEKILAAIDKVGLKPVHQLEGRDRGQLAEWNKKNPTKAIHTFAAAFNHRDYHRAVSRRLYRAESNFVREMSAS